MVRFVLVLGVATLTTVVLGSGFAAPAAARPIDGDHWFSSLSWRCIGPSRGGRVQSVCGVVGDRLTYYMGATGGGVWKTTNAGASWENITDGFVGTGSVGAVTVAPSDPNVIYLGMGEADIRGNFSHGDGVYRSVDAGKTWEHVGLEDTRQIGRIEVHPDNPDTVFVAALGHVFGPNAQRGVFKSTDGGETWRRVLFVSDKAGAIDVEIDPHNPRNVFAAIWQVRRTPWSLESGGEDGGLYRSRDGGETWEEVTDGLPAAIKGKIGVSVSGAQRDRVWAILEADEGGVFRSDDGGDSWQRVNQNRALRQRAWYYTHIYADPVNPDTVYVMNVQFHKSTDGGRSFSRIHVPHVDNHDLWIDPQDPRRMINANDGGANVSFDGGRTWSRQDNQPTAQFYHVTTDNRHPYRVYGAQQDNSTMSISSVNRLGGRDEYYAVGGGESGYIAVHPEDPDLVFAGSYGGYMTMYDHELGKTRNISVWPENPMGAGAADLVHRFQWTFPIVISPHDPETLYAGGERLFRSMDRGASWEAISPDLTTNDKSKQASSGGPITQDNTSVEYYCTIFSVAESPLEQGRIWVGSDDGLVHVTADEGASWTDVTPTGMGDWPLISMVEASYHDADTAYLAVNRYKMDDFAPYVYRTRDLGATWDRIDSGIDEDAFVRVIREDPEVAGLLFAGTETGVWVSFDDGARWQSLQLELPVVPVTDLVVHNDDLVISTQGRSFWILSGVSLLRQLATETVDPEESVLFRPAPVYRERWDRLRIHANLPDGVDVASILAMLDSDGAVIREFDLDIESDADTGAEGEDEGDESESQDDRDADELSGKPGMNAFEWNLRLPDPVEVPGAVGWPPTPPGPRIAPGEYVARLTVGEDVVEQPFVVLADPRLDTPQAGFEDQYDLLLDVHGALSDAHRAVNRIRDARKQINLVVAQAKRADIEADVADRAKSLLETLDEIENDIIQTKSKSRQDPLNYPIRINDKIGALLYVVSGDYPPTEQSRRVFERLEGLLNEQLDRLNAVIEDDIEEFNEFVRNQPIPAVIIGDGEP